MSLALDFICSLPDGVHARPAGALAKAARRFISEITLTNTRTGKSANGKSVLAVISAGIRQSDTCRLSVSGSDETTAMATLSGFLSKIFPYCDDTLPASPARTAKGHNPKLSALRETRATDAEVRALLHPGLIVLDAGCKTKADAIKQAANLLQVAGRTKRPRELEHAIWQREAVSSTAFGHGFAIPHCKSGTVLANSLVILKLRTPVDWGSTDHQSVHLIILMAIREADQASGHMKIFSQLARKLMDGAFRERVASEPDPNALGAFLNQSFNM